MKNIEEKNRYSVSKTRDPLLVWFLYTIVMSIILSTTLLRSIITGITSDSSHISVIIAITFIAAFIFSFVHAYTMRKEWCGINRLNDKKTLQEASSEAEKLVLSIINHPRRDMIRIRDMVDSYYSRLEVPLRTLTVMSGLMVTLGLIGTILGLIISVGGLENVMQNVGGANGPLLSGVQETIRGMAIAFYSTLFGAVMGAVILRVLSMSLSNSLVRMSCGLFEYLELLPNTVDQQFNLSLTKATYQFTKLSIAAAQAEKELKTFTSTNLDSRLASIATQLESCISALKDIRK